MKSKAFIIFLLLSFLTVSSYAQQKKVEVTYIGNSGFLLNIGDKKILIDALFKGFKGNYELPQEIQDKLTLAQAPFDNVDLILVSHAHGDHVNLDMVKQHLQNNPKAIFASTQQMVDAFKDSTDRCIGFNPTKEKPERKVINDISIEAFYLPHGPDSRIINIGFLISVNGITVFQTGDADFDQFTFEEFRSLQLPERNIDLAFIQHYYLRGDSLRTKFIREAIGGDYIFPIHYHFTTPSFDAAIIKENYPGAILFDKELESWKMPTKNGEISTLGEYYFNQQPPSDSAVIFAPGIFSLPNRLESNITFSPDGKECYFGILEIKDNKASYKIYQSKYVNNKWTEQTEAPFSINNNISDPIFSADGKKLYFNKEGDIWMIERSLEGWGEPQALPSPINSDSRDGSYTETADGDIYISSRRSGGFGGMDNWRINRLANQSLQAENLGPILNSKYFDYSPFIAPDGSYLIFGSYRARRDGLLYISFNIGNDDWTTPINMNSCGAKVNNTTAHHSNPSLSPDGKYLFFRRHANMMEMDVYWVSTNILKKLKEKAMQESSPLKFTDLKGDYLGQTLPGDSAVIFAPGIFSLPDRLESNIVFTPDGKECYFGILEIKENKASYKIYQSKYVNNKWTEQSEAPFSINNNINDPILSADGKKLYFNKEGDIWMIERASEGWGEPKKLPAPINSDVSEGSITESADGDIYISSRRKGGFGGIDNWRINRLADQSLQAENLGPIMNSKYFDYSPFIAPDGSYLIFGSYRKGKHGQADLFISFNKGNDDWTTPINMNSCGAKVNNTTAHHSNPSLSPDGKYLFFRRHETMMEMDVYWVSTNIIKKLKKKAMQESSPQKFTDLKGDYLGQTPPGDVPAIFAPGIISVDSTIEHGAPTFSPDGNEVFWQSNYRQSGKKTQVFCMTMKRINDRWTAPEKTQYGFGPVFSPDGKRLYFNSNKEGDDPSFIEKLDNGWSELKKLNLITRFPELKFARTLTFTNKGTLYFMAYAEGLSLRKNIGIYRTELINGVYSKPELLPPVINTPGDNSIANGRPFIAPDESYLISCSRRMTPKDDYGGLYICFQKPDGSWTKKVSLGESINFRGTERFPSVSRDGKYLFFTRWVSPGNEDVMWVSAEIINKIKTQVFADISLNEEMFKAVAADDLEKVKALIKSDPSLLESKDKSGSTPLIRACLNLQTFGTQVEVAKFLIEAGANVNVINNSKATALLRASSGRGPDYELIKLLVEKGADVNVQGYNGITALHLAVMKNDLKIARLLLESGADINISNDYNGPIRTSTISGTVLHTAINYSQSNEMVQFVIENGAKLNIKDSQGNTELHLVALKGNTEQAKNLIEHGIDLNAKNNFNRTALYYAAKHGYRGVSELLIASGADKNTIVETNYGKAKQLSESIDEGEAYIWDLGARYAVKTKNNLLVFTLGGKIGESSESGLANGFLNADELKDQKITMFLRHRGYRNIGGKAFTELANLTADVNMVSSFEPDFSKTKESEIPAYHLALPNESFSVNGLKVHPIPALASGMGYLVEVDGLKIFHAGLHISDDKPEHIEKFRKEIDFLKPFGPIDIVMLSTHSHSNYVGVGYEQYLYLLDKLAPKAIYLWGANVQEQYKICADFLKVRNIPIVYPEIKQAAGERFHYAADKAQK